MKMTDVRIREVAYHYDDYLYRTPIKFGGVATDRVTILNVDVTLESRSGQIGRGFGSMTLGNAWSYPSRHLSYWDTLAAMKAVITAIAQRTEQYQEYGHPIDLTHALEPQYHQEAHRLSEELKLADPIPPLSMLVCASAFDAALHDGFGRLHQLNCYHTYGPDFMSYDLSHYLGGTYQGLTLDRFVNVTAQPTMPLYHLIGALDPLTPADVAKPVGDGGPETLIEWINADGLTHLKIKLNGDDLNWDVNRVLSIDRVAMETQQQRGVSQWYYSLDFNERCQNVEYLLAFLHRVKEATPAGFERIQYIEQPTARDLKANPENRMHEAAKLRPVVIDESLLDQESIYLAREMGYTGVALKACKGQSQSLLMAAVAQQEGMFLCVQDLTCPGASLLHSAGLAAHIPGVAAIESNARQFVPIANESWKERYPGIFVIRDGRMQTGCLDGIGLSTQQPS